MTMITQAEHQVRNHSWRQIFDQPEELSARASEILRRNDMEGWTRAAPTLYPHQWSWDSAFVAVGLAHLDTRRAAQELRTLFAHQWRTGKVPHIVFNPKAPPESYFPGADHWACAASSPDAPPVPPYTSCLCQPPVHAIAALRIWEVAGREDEKAFAEATDFLREIYPRLFAWHRYLATFRDPERSGLVTIYHPWASGADNSPRWDSALAAVEVGEMPTYPRYDLDHVDGPSERPASTEYDRYLWLVKLINKLSQNSHDRLSSLVIPTERGPAMSENPPQQKPITTIWRVPDELSEIIEPIIQEHDPPKNTGRPRVDQRAALDAIIFRMRSGVQWNRLPKGEFPDDSSVHRTFQRWVELGVLDLIWAQMIAECEELGGVNFEWQAADGAMGKARFGGIS